MIHFFIAGCFFLSGAAGLVYQVLWLRMLDKVFGGAPFTVAAVLSIFMAGLALGGYLAGKKADRGPSKSALLMLYGKLEIGIGIYALILPILIAGIEPVYRFIYDPLLKHFWCYQAAAFIGCLVLLILPTSLMGATLPVLCRFYVTRMSHLGSRTGRLYALNTIGAALGTVLCGFILIKNLGVMKTLFIAAGINGLIGLSCILIARYIPLTATWNVEPSNPLKPRHAPLPGKKIRQEKGGETPDRHWVLAIFAVSGFSAMAFEVIWTRLLGLVAGPTTYSFTVVVATFIIGLALGGMIFGFLADRVRNVFTALILTQWGAAMSALAVSHLLGNSQFLFAKIIYTFHDNFSQLIQVQSIVLFVLLLGPTLFLGAAFPLVNRIYVQSMNALGSSLGRACAVNTIGAVLGSFAAGFILIPLLGKENGLKLVILIQCLTASLALIRGNERKKWKNALAGSGVMFLVFCLLIFYPSWHGEQLSRGWYRDFAAIESDLDQTGFVEALFKGGEKLARHRQGLSVVFHGEGIGGFTTVEKEITSMGTVEYAMFNSGKADASSHGDRSTQTLSAHIPMLFHPEPENVMVLGLASGMTPGEVLLYPVRTLDVVEINEQVIKACRRHFSSWNYHCLNDPRTSLILQDGRNHLALTRSRYDVIISEPSNPWMAGLANLYTREFFQLVRNRLQSDGIFAQWIQSYEMDWDTFSLLGRTFAGVFPDSALVKVGPVDYLLMGFMKCGGFNRESALKKLEFARGSRNVCFTGIDFIAHLILTEDLPALFGPGPVHTDDLPVLEFMAPRKLYAENLDIDRIAANQRRFNPDTQKFLENAGNRDVLLDLIEFSASAGEPMFDAVNIHELSPEQNIQYRKIVMDYCGQFLAPSYAVFGDTELKRECAVLQAEKMKQKISSYSALPADHYNLGLALIASGRKPEAAKQFQAAVALDPHHEPAFTALGLLAAENGNFQAASCYLSSAASLAPRKVETVKYLGMVERLLCRLDKAEAYLETAFSLAPEDPLILGELGAVYLSQGRGPEAMEFLIKALKIDPHDPEIRHNLNLAKKQINGS